MIVKIFLFWRIGLLLVTYIGSIILPKIANSGIGAVAPGKKLDFWASWAQWDGGHYFELGKHWFTKSEEFAFFPLYPLMIRFFSKIALGNVLVSGLLISNVAFLIFLIVFFKLIKKRFTKITAYNTLITFLVFPTTFFGVAFYSEALFLVLVVVAFWFLYEKKFFWAAIFTSMASLARLTGVILAIAIVYSYLASIKFKLKNIDLRIFYVFLSFAGIILYSAYLLINYDDPLKYLAAQSFWQRSIIGPAATLASYVWPMLSGQNRPIHDYFDLASTLFFLSVLILGIKKIPSSLWIFSVLVILIPASSGTLTSMPRYLLASLGVFVIIGRFLEEKPKFRFMIWAISLTCQAILATLFVNGYWIA